LSKQSIFGDEIPSLYSLVKILFYSAPFVKQEHIPTMHPDRKLTRNLNLKMGQFQLRVALF